MAVPRNNFFRNCVRPYVRLRIRPVAHSSSISRFPDTRKELVRKMRYLLSTCFFVKFARVVFPAVSPQRELTSYHGHARRNLVHWSGCVDSRVACRLHNHTSAIDSRTAYRFRLYYCDVVAGERRPRPAACLRNIGFREYETSKRHVSRQCSTGRVAIFRATAD